MYLIDIMLYDSVRCIFYGDLYPNQECYDDAIALELKLLLEVRKKHAYGEIKDYFVHKNCIGFVRKGDSQHRGCVVVISNGGSKNRYAALSRIHKRYSLFLCVLKRSIIYALDTNECRLGE